jgi:hypothetical protein
MSALIESQQLVVAKLTHRRRDDVTVTVTTTMIMVEGYPDPVPGWYVVTTSTGYRAQFQACRADGCLSEELTPCSCKGRSAQGSNWRSHSRTHCHEWHDDKIMAFARDVLKTYDKSRATLTAVGSKRGGYSPGSYARCPSWPIERAPLRGDVSFTDGLGRPASYGIDIDKVIETNPPK